MFGHNPLIDDFMILPTVAESMNNQNIFQQHFISHFLTLCDDYAIEEQRIHPNVQWNRSTGVDTGDSFLYDSRKPKSGSISDFLKRTLSCIPCLPYAYYWLRRVCQRGRIRVIQKLSKLTNEDVELIVEDVACELSIVFEYQLGMISGRTHVQMLAEHAVDCIFTYLRRNDSELTRNDLLYAVLTVLPKKRNKSKFVLHTKFDQNENCKYKWRLHHVLKYPGLRVQDSSQPLVKCKFYRCYTPWGQKCKPQIYGYRAPMYNWNEHDKVFELCSVDKTTMAQGGRTRVDFSSMDPHQQFIPTFWYISWDELEKYTAYIRDQKSLGSNNMDSLNLFVKYMYNIPKEIHCVFRPENKTVKTITFTLEPETIEMIESSKDSGSDLDGAVLELLTVVGNKRSPETEDVISSQMVGNEGKPNQTTDHDIAKHSLNLSGGNFNETNFSHCHFDKLVPELCLENVQFQRCSLQKCNLEKFSIRCSDFAESDFSYSNIKNLYAVDSVNFSKARFRYCIVEGAHLHMDNEDPLEGESDEDEPMTPDVSGKLAFVNEAFDGGYKLSNEDESQTENQK
ncbi:unnamed protein product [Owenia fusiformis]|uniref:Uncharacterized protein n=1 Tax=Owenia fusiformis TaxID=6347 RepID=A0A8J1Y531_OWEFU|nr:unnamed protein product [Owenia fusiformis]